MIEWIPAVSMFLASAALICWFRQESRSDYRHMDAKIEANLQAIRDEMKDFHGRLCAIEERNKTKA